MIFLYIYDFFYVNMGDEQNIKELYEKLNDEKLLDFFNCVLLDTIDDKIKLGEEKDFIDTKLIKISFKIEQQLCDYFKLLVLMLQLNDIILAFQNFFECPLPDGLDHGLHFISKAVLKDSKDVLKDPKDVLEYDPKLKNEIANTYFTDLNLTNDIEHDETAILDKCYDLYKLIIDQLVPKNYDEQIHEAIMKPDSKEDEQSITMEQRIENVYSIPIYEDKYNETKINEIDNKSNTLSYLYIWS